MTEQTRELWYTCDEDLDDDSNLDTGDGDAIAEHLQRYKDNGDPLPETVTLYGYAKKSVSDEWLLARAKDLLESFDELWMEEFGAYNEATGPAPESERLIVTALQEFIKLNPVFQLEHKAVTKEVINVQQWASEFAPDILEETP